MGSQIPKKEIKRKAKIAKINVVFNLRKLDRLIVRHWKGEIG